MNIRGLAAILILPALIVGCTEPTLDASSKERFKESTEEVSESLNAGEKEEFDEALKTILGERLDMAAIFRGEKSPEDAAASVMASVDGKTAHEVITEGQKILREREARQREQALQEIVDLKNKKKVAEAAVEELKKFEVNTSRLYKREDGFMTKPIIEMSVTNNTGHAISRAYFEGVVASPGRSVPWIEETFNYSIPGGLEPGESANWSLAPNQFSAWGTEVPKDAILTLIPYKLEGPDFDASTAAFSERDQERLETLQKTYVD